MKFLFFVTLMFSVNAIVAQHAIRGRVVDEKTREPLAFVNIKINDNPRLGVITDIDGNFRYESTTPIKTLMLSYVGYERKTVHLDSLKNHRQLVLPLNRTRVELQSVTIVAGENPAHRIIRQVTANRRINNPENVRSFKYQSHNKIITDAVFSGERRINDTLIRTADTMQARFRRDLRGGYLFLSETLTERIFRYPNQSQETILATRTSGFQNYALPFSATDFQPFSFYNDHFKLLDVNYLSPIAGGSTNHYFFNIEDTIYQNQDTVFVISFRPRIGRNIEGLKGVLQINTNKYAVQNVIAEPAEPGLWNMKIQQKYEFIEDTQWFPSQLNFEVSLAMGEWHPNGFEISSPSKSKSAPLNLVMNGRSYIDNIELFPDLRGRDFSIDQVILDAAAKIQDSLFWAERRVVPLDSMEMATYRFIDSLGEVANFDGIFTVFDKLFQNRIPIKWFDIDLSNTLLMNEFEGWRLGFGLYTNERLFKNFSVGGFLGWGTKDKLWKYGGEGIWNISRKYEIDLRIGYQNTLLETGRGAMNLMSNRFRDWRDFMASQMDQIEEKSVGFGFRAFRYAKFNVAMKQTHVNPLYDDYIFQNDMTTYNYTSLNVGLRYAFGERFVRTSQQRMSMGTKFPVFHVNYSRGINDFLNGDFEFNKVEFRMDKSFVWKILGVSKVRVDAGMVDRPLPYGMLFTGDGSYDKWMLFVPNYFQTMRKYEFLSDQYANVFLSHNFGSLFLRIKKFRPHFTLHHNMGLGRLSNPDYQQNIEFQTKDKGFFESGLQIDNILRLNYVNVAYLGFGAGIYYRYGDYAFEKPAENFVFKFSFTFSTR